MKRTLLLLLLLLAVHFSHGQGAKKGDIALTAGFGLGSYRASINDTTAKGGATVFPFSVEYHLGNKLSAGAVFQQSIYLIGGPTTNLEEKAKGFFTGAQGLYHFLDTARFNIYAGLAVGYDNIRFDITDEDKERSVLAGGGFGYRVHAGVKVFATHHLGFFMDINYAGYCYNWNFYQLDGEEAELPNAFTRLRYNGLEGKLGTILKF